MRLVFQLCNSDPLEYDGVTFFSFNSEISSYEVSMPDDLVIVPASSVLSFYVC